MCGLLSSCTYNTLSHVDLFLGYYIQTNHAHMIKLYIVIFVIGMACLFYSLLTGHNGFIIGSFLVTAFGAAKILTYLRQKYGYKGISEAPPKDPYADLKDDDED